MVTKRNWKKKVVEFIRLLRQEIDVERAIVFGSYARGTPKPYSDLDVAIISRHFDDRHEMQHMQYLFRKAQQVDTAIEPHPYHPRDLRRIERGTLLAEISRYGVVIR